MILISVSVESMKVWIETGLSELNLLIVSNINIKLFAVLNHVVFKTVKEKSTLINGKNAYYYVYLLRLVLLCHLVCTVMSVDFKINLRLLGGFLL